MILYFYILDRENGILTPIKRSPTVLSPDRAESGLPHTPSKEDSSAVSVNFRVLFKAIDSSFLVIRFRK